jgi:Protease subunit of ATP-dependent Clp proteases
MIYQQRTPAIARSIAGFWGKSLDDKQWYTAKTTGENTAEIRIYDIIGWPFVEASEFARDLDAITADTITVKINCPGGDVFDGIAIYNMLVKKSARIITEVEGLAASMASIISLAADPADRKISASAYYMIHNPSTFAWGDYRVMEKSRALLKETIGEGMIDIYAQASGKSPAEMQKIMDDETWYTGKAAVDAGFLGAVIDQKPAATGAFNLDIFNHAPATPEQPLTKREIEQKLTQDAGFSRSTARLLLQGGFDALNKQDAGEPTANPQTLSSLNGLIKAIGG